MKFFLWLPYTKTITCKKESVLFVFKGGEQTCPWKDIHSIMFYGAVCPLEQGFLDYCSRHAIPLCIHRRNMPRAIWITPSSYVGHDDLMTLQILFRENKKKRAHIAKQLLKAKFRSMEWLRPYPAHDLHRTHAIKDLIQIEAYHARDYWGRYYQGLGCPHLSRRSPDPHNHIKTVLDAVSKFMVGIILRWILYHRLTPFHGYIHIPHNYPALAYDLLEPYRGYIEKVMFEQITALQAEEADVQSYVPCCIEKLKETLYSEVYVHTTRQVVTLHELLHGSVLALRSYLKANTTKMVVPMPGKPVGGRPIKAGYRLYGRSAGITDFFPTAQNELSGIAP